MKKLSENYFLAVKNFLPGKVVRPVVGLDIGVSSCRMVEVLNRPDGCELLKWAIEPIVGDPVKTIRSVMSKASQPNLSPVTALTGKGTLIRFIEMPKMSLEELKRSFSFEVDKYFPFPKDQIFTDCHIIDPNGKDNKLPVLVAAAKKELVHERIKLLNDAGLQVDFITLNSIAIANVFDVLGSPGEAKAGQTIAVLDIGEVVSNLTIFVDDKPKFNRDIFIGGRDFTKAISNALRVSLAEAEKIKQQPEARAQEVAGIIDSSTQDLVSELRLSLDYFVTESNLTLGQLFVTGGAAMMQDLQANLAKHLEMTVNSWNPVGLLKLGPGVNAEEINAKAGSLGVALGLALYS